MVAFGGISRCEQSKERGHVSLSKHRYIHHIQDSLEPSYLPETPAMPLKYHQMEFTIPLTQLKRLTSHFIKFTQRVLFAQLI